MKFLEQYDKNRIIIFLGSIMLLICVAFIAVLFFKMRKLEDTVEELRTSLYGSHNQEELAAEDNTQSKMETLYNVNSDVDINDKADNNETDIAGNDNGQTELSDDPYEGKIKVYLTFDDGPSNNTDKILDILGEYGIKATFFVNGREKFDNQYKRIVDEGHTIGMHSYSHDYRTVYKSLDSFAEDLYSIQNFVYEKTGVTPVIYRFPGGSSNNVSKMDMKDAIGYLNAKGIVYYDWNASAQDAVAGGATVTQIVSNITNTIYSGEETSYVVLLHDCDDKKSTVEALPIVIEKLINLEDVVILPIDENTTPTQHVTVE